MAKNGGVGLVLTHGSVLLEVARAETHCTTAVAAPDRVNPSRIGVVLYAHGHTHRPNHGKEHVIAQTAARDKRDYEAWRRGLFVPTPRRLKELVSAGYSMASSSQSMAGPKGILQS